MSSHNSLVGALGLATVLLVHPIGHANAEETSPPPTDEAYESALKYLDQGWSHETANWWYYLSQGTVFVPYEWFLALEQADGQELFASPGNMSRMGFLVDPPNPEIQSRRPAGRLREARSSRSTRALQVLAGQLGRLRLRRLPHRPGQLSRPPDPDRGRRRPSRYRGIPDAVRRGARCLASARRKCTRFFGRLLGKGIGGSPEALKGSLPATPRRPGKSRAFFEEAQAGASRAADSVGLRTPRCA